MILGGLCMIAANAAVCLAACWVVRNASTGKPHLDVSLFMLVRLSLISILILGGGVSRLLNPIALGGAGVVGLLAMTVAGEFGRLRPLRSIDAGPVLTIFSAVVLIRLAAQIWAFAPYNYDALSYHLTKVAEWVRAGGFVREMGVDTHAPFPAGFELVETWWVVFLHHDVLIEAAGVEFLILAVSAAYGVARELGLSVRSSSMAAAAYGMTPGLHLSATSCLNDAPVAALVVTTLAVIQSRIAWPWVVLVLGMGVGLKPTFAYAIPGPLVLWLLVRRNSALAPSPKGVAALVVLLGIVLGSFWYLRNALWFGSPIYPVGTKGLVASTGLLKIQFGPSLTSGVKNVSDLVESRVYDNFIAYGSLLIRTSGWGPLAFACGILSSLIVAKKEAQFRGLGVACLVSLGSVLLLVNHDDWYMRFVLFFPVVLCIGAAKFAEDLQPLRYLIAACLAFQFLATFVPLDLPLRFVTKLWAQEWRQRSAAVVYDAIPQSSPVAYYIVEPVHERGESYFLYGPDYSRKVTYFRRKATALDISREMDASQTPLLYRSRETPSDDPVLLECQKLGLIRQVSGRFFERVQR